MKLKILNSRETRDIVDSISRQFGSKIGKDHAFMKNSEGKVYVVSRDLARVDTSRMRIDSVGLYIGTITPEGFRPSIEGSQIIGKTAARNIVDIDRQRAQQWLMGNVVDTEDNASGFVIVRHGGDFLGAGKIKDGRILNYVPKTRRTNAEI